MANKIITFSQDPIQKRLQDNPYEVFLDIGMTSKMMLVDRHWYEFKHAELSDHYTFLRDEGSDAAISVIAEKNTDDSPDTFIALFPDNNYSKIDIIPHTDQVNEFKITKLVNVNAIRNSLNNIFSWTPGERVLNPEFGTNLRKLLYEGITDFNVERITAEIKHAVAQWEPRVQVTNIVDASTTEDHENNTVHLKVVYIIPGLSDQQFEYDYVSLSERT